MAERKVPMLDGPIPGQSLTAEPGSRPWEQPSRYSTVEETLSFYIDSLSEPKKLAVMLDKIEEGAPLTLIADSLQTMGVMKGIHSLDVGVLISPVLIEYMKAVAENADVPYTVGIEDEDVANEKDEAMANMVAKEIYNASPAEEEAPMGEEEQMMDESPMPERKGLMARNVAPAMESEEMMQDGV